MHLLHCYVHLNICEVDFVVWFFNTFLLLRSQQVLELDDLHLLSRSTQAHLNISLILQQYVVRSHGIRFHHTYHLIHEQYLSQILFTHLASSWSKICHVSALIICCSFKRTTCTSRIFSKINAMFLPLSFAVLYRRISRVLNLLIDLVKTQPLFVKSLIVLKTSVS